jgi:hypothetical protein
MSVEAFERFLDVMLPGGGCAVAFTEVYLDESYDDRNGSPLLCVAGYVFTKSKAKEFSRKWAAYLERKGLPYFHMSECAHGNGVFKGKDCDGIARELIRRTRQDTEFGVAITINEGDYAELVGKRDGMRSAYAFALMMCMHHVANWRQRTGARGQTAFFFESGHKHQNDANEWISWMVGSPLLQGALQYSGHAFVPKVTPGLHPADNLAWHWRLETSRRQDPNRTRPIRGDLRALMRDGDVYGDVSRARLEQFAADLEVRELERAEMDWQTKPQNDLAAAIAEFKAALPREGWMMGGGRYE